tara:strand:+ start:207 stop:1433 length:1227 start_codon:yes stop_codon:yes gene_type:complete
MPGSTTDTVPTMLTPGEFVIKRESAKMLGKPFLEQLNAVSDNSAHSSIDALISQAALAQMKPMEGGGVVNEYMGGGDVSNYMGGGDVMSYMYGGGVMEKKKKKMAGYQEGGDVDATSVNLDNLLALLEISELQKKNPLSNLSMVDADRVDAENQEILNTIIDSVMPGGAIGSIKQTGKLAPLAKKFASLAPDKGKQKVLDKIASEMSVAPSRKVMQNPSRNLYDYKDYKVLEKKPESFDAMDLINKGYLQKYTNKLVRNMNPSGSVKLGDIVDADYASNMRGGYYNINDMVEGVIKMPKKERMKAAKDLLKYFNINLRNVKGKQEGGEVADSLFGMSMDDFNKILANELLESSMTGENLPKRIELSPEEDKFRNNPNPDKPFGMTILDDLLLRAYEQYRFGRLPSMKD